MPAYAKKILSLVSEMEQILAENQLKEMEEFLQPSIESFRNKAESKPFVELVYYGNFSAEETAKLDRYLNFAEEKNNGSKLGERELALSGGEQVGIQFSDWASTNLSGSYQPDRLVAIAVLAKEGISEAMLSHLGILMEGCAAALVFSHLDWKQHPVHKEKLESGTGWLFLRPLESIDAMGLSTDLEGLMAQGVRRTLVDFSGYWQAERLKGLFEEKYRQAEVHLKIRKLQMDQELGQYKSMSTATTGSMEAQQIRAAIEERLEQFEKRLGQQMETNLLPPAGAAFHAISTHIETLSELSEEKGSKHLVYTIPDAFLQQLAQEFRKSYASSCSHSKALALQTVQSIENDIDNFLQERQLKMLSRTASALLQLDEGALIQRNLHLDRPFEQRAPNKKIMEFFMGARMYYMILMMTFSMLGLSSIIMRSRLNLVPISIVLVGLGIFQVSNSRRREKEENKVKQLEAARSFLRNEYKRMAQEIARSWEKELLDQAKGVARRIQQQAEQTLQSAQSGQKTRDAEERNRLQHIIAQLSKQERNLESARRNFSMLEKNFSRAKEELRSAIQQQLLKFRKPSTNESRH